MDPTENDETVTDETGAEEGGQPEGEETPDADLTPNDRPEPRKTRKERRADYAASFKEQLRERDTALAAERNERQRIDRELAELRGRFAERDKGAPDPTEAKLTALEDKANSHLEAVARLNAAKDAVGAKRELALYHKAIREAAILEIKAENEKNAPRAEQPLAPEVREIKQKLSSEFGWLEYNDAARNAASMLADQMVRDGKPSGYATFRAACASIASALKLGGNERATNGQKQRFSAVSGGEGAGGEGDDSVYRMTRDDMKMAEALYPQLEAEAAHRKWEKAIGSKMNGARQ